MYVNVSWLLLKLEEYDVCVILHMYVVRDGQEEEGGGEREMYIIVGTQMRMQSDRKYMHVYYKKSACT